MSGKVDCCSSDEAKHAGDATCLAFYNDHVISGGADGKIKIWNRNLQLVRELSNAGPDAAPAYVYTLAVNAKSGRLYSSASDGTIRFFRQLFADDANDSDAGQILMCTEYDTIGALCCARTDDGNVLWSGDDKGVVIKWVDDRIAYKYNLVEEVRSLCVENTFVYTARDLDAVVTDVGHGKTGQYVTAGTIAGRSPLALVGPLQSHTIRRAGFGAREDRGSIQEVLRRRFLLFATRDGRGIQMVRNDRGFEPMWTVADGHEMIINALCGDERFAYTAGYDGVVKKWTELSSPNGALMAGEAKIGHCVNALCLDESGDAVYAADTRGIVSKITFSGVAA